VSLQSERIGRGSELVVRLPVVPTEAVTPNRAEMPEHGVGHLHDRGHTAAAGLDAHLVKPVSDLEILKTLADLDTLRNTAQNA
jgi:hypothetical protein